jgi:hypothetical protein
MPLNKFIIRYDNVDQGEADLQDMGVGPLGYVYEYNDAYRRAKQLAKTGVSNVRVVRRVIDAPEEVVAAIEA